MSNRRFTAPRPGRVALRARRWLQALAQQLPHAMQCLLTVLPLGAFFCDHNPQTTLHQPGLEIPCSRARRNGPRQEQFATSNNNSTRESVVLTPCPPGPDERLNRQRRSLDGMTNRSFTTRSCTSHLLGQEQQDAASSPSDAKAASGGLAAPGRGQAQKGGGRTVRRRHSQPFPYRTPHLVLCQQ